MSADGDDFIPAHEAQRFVRRSRYTLYRWRRRGAPDGTRIVARQDRFTGVWWYSKASLERIEASKWERRDS